MRTLYYMGLEPYKKRHPMINILSIGDRNGQTNQRACGSKNKQD